MYFLRQNGEDLDQEGHGGDVAAVPEKRNKASVTLFFQKGKTHICLSYFQEHHGPVQMSEILLFDECMNTALPRSHLKSQVSDC